MRFFPIDEEDGKKEDSTAIANTSTNSVDFTWSGLARFWSSSSLEALEARHQQRRHTKYTKQDETQTETETETDRASTLRRMVNP